MPISPRILLATLTLWATAGLAQSWPQWGQSPRHSGSLPTAGPRLSRNIADIIYDPFVPQMVASSGGNLLAHYAAPLVDSSGAVYMTFKGGQFTSRNTWETMTWSVSKFQWQGAELGQAWRAESDWKPVPFGSPRWEPVFHAALSGAFVYAPGGGGTVLKIDRSTGSIVRRINPFGASADPRTFVVGPLTVDDAGNILYNAIRFTAAGDVWGNDVVGAWLVRIGTDDSSAIVSFASLIPDAPEPGAPCLTSFDNTQLPWPPSPSAVPPAAPCGSQRPGINVAPAVGQDGTIYTISRTHFNPRYGYLVAVNPDLTRKWASSLRDRLNDGCGITIPPNGTPGGCREGTPLGIDPADNTRGAGRVVDDSTSSPTVTPDGSILYGAYTAFNYRQGHLMKFSASGAYQGSYEFGWDVTPAIWEHEGTYSIVIKENRYSTSSYCSNDPQFCPSDRTAATPNDPEAYYITQLDRNLRVEWKYRNSETRSCVRLPDGSQQCESDHPNGFEWCVNAPAIDGRGVVYANSEDGYLYAIAQPGVMRDRIFQIQSQGAAYTPASLGGDGKIYSQNSGHLFVVGSFPRGRAARRK